MTDPRAPRPFLKWAGGKAKQAEQIVELLGDFPGCYFEPFLGGGAVFFALRPERAVLSDVNERLVNCYRVIQDEPEYVIDQLQALEDSREEFETLRDKMNHKELDDLDRAVAFIYLNRTCFNGLYRENSNGGFNVPYASPRGGRRIVNAENLIACSDALEPVLSIEPSDFEAMLDAADSGDAVYCDPPYLPENATSFTEYSAGGFCFIAGHVRLRDRALAAKRRGVRVVLSNSGASATRDLYADHFTLTPVMARRNINRKGDERGPVLEYLIH